MKKKRISYSNMPQICRMLLMNLLKEFYPPVNLKTSLKCARKKKLLAVLQYSNHQNSEPIVKKGFFQISYECTVFGWDHGLRKSRCFYQEVWDRFRRLVKKFTILSFSHYRVSEAVDQNVDVQLIEPPEKKWDLNWDLEKWSKSVVTAKYD